MKPTIYINLFLAVFFLFLGTQRATAQITLTMDSISCGTDSTTLHASIDGDIPLSSGITEDDIYAPSPYTIGFTFQYYGTPYTEVLIGANGNLCFDYSLAGSYDPWPISAALLGNSSVLNSICGPWCDIYVPAYGTITYSNDGVAPNRRFVVNFCHCAMFSCTTQWITTQMVLHETSNLIDIYVSHKTFCTSWNGGYAIIGVQNATGTDAVTAPGRDYPATYNCTDEAWEFTPISGGTTYSVAPVLFAPVPLSSTMIYWYDSSTGAFIDSGATLNVSATTSGTYEAVGLGCSDSSFAYVHVTPSSGLDLYTFGTVGTDISTHTNPTLCGTANGTITIKGHGMRPGLTDTAYYTLNGVVQPAYIGVVTTDSTVVISGLCSGTYDSVLIEQTGCSATPIGPIVLDTPAMRITSINTAPPPRCGDLNGTMTLSGLYPSMTYTVNFDRYGFPQSPVTVGTSTLGTATITGLCSGNYTNVTATLAGCIVCVTPNMPGPYVVATPEMSIDGLTFTEPHCGMYDGQIMLYGLYPTHPFQITFDTTGVLVSPSTVYLTDTSGTLTITGLSGGNVAGDSITYTNITVYYDSCDTCQVVFPNPITLGTQPDTLHLFDPVSPSQCGFCDGSISIKAAYPFSLDTISYLMNGVVVPSINTYANVDSYIVLNGLCSGNYAGFTVKEGACYVTTIGTENLINPQLFAGFGDQIHYGCSGDTVLFNNESVFPNAVTPPVASYSWNFGDVSAVDTVANPDHIYLQQGTYTVTLTTSNGACIDDTSVVVTLSHPLKAGFSYAPVSGVVCQDNQVAFTDTSSGDIIGYQWNFGNGVTTNTLNANYTYKNYGVYTVSLIVSNFVPCYDTATAVIQVDSQSNATMAISDPVICRGTDINFTGTYTKSGLTSITWNFGNGDSVQNVNPVIKSYDAAGVFTVTANVYYRACIDQTATGVVTVNAQPEINLGAADTTVCTGSSPVVLRDNINATNPAASWLWSTGQTGPQISVGQAGIYTVTVAIGGCKSSYTVDVQNSCYVNVPNAFSPSLNSVDNYFLPSVKLTAGLTTFSMNIYNRWGELIFQTNSLDGRGWDGKFNGLDQPAGVYIYAVDATFQDGEKEHLQGNLTLLR